MEKFLKNRVLLITLLYLWIHVFAINCELNKFDLSPPNKKLDTDGISKNVSRVLNQLLKGYDKRIRPNYAGPPVLVGITININNINSVSEVNMDYSLDIFFRQLWVDKRLSFDLSADGIYELVIGADMLHRIWLPDTFIANDKKTYFHKATVQNKFIRINPDGQVLYSTRMTVTAACPMNFRYFPMDHQVCDLEIESYGFRMDDIKYKWGEGFDNASALHISPDIELPQLKYKDSRLIEREFRLSTGLYSRLTMKLYFVRSLGYYIIQIYIPSTLIVSLSWVSFWLDISAAPARITLGMTTVLTMVTFIWSTNASLPKISYIKGIDVYLVMCFVMTFSSVIEYAIVSFIFNRFEKKKKVKENKEREQREKENSEISNSGIHNPLQQLLVIKNSTTNLDSPALKDLNKSETMNDYEHQHSLSKKDMDGSPNKSLPILIEKKCRCNDCKQGDNHAYSMAGPMKKSISTPSNHKSHLFNESNHINQHICQCNLEKENVYFSQIHSSMPYRISVLPQPKKHRRKQNFLYCIAGIRIKAVTIDKYSRAVFPIVFTTFHVVYWTVYLTISSSLWYLDAIE